MSEQGSGEDKVTRRQFLKIAGSTAAFGVLGSPLVSRGIEAVSKLALPKK